VRRVLLGSALESWAMYPTLGSVSRSVVHFDAAFWIWDPDK
jgi:hypothetical protein